MDVKFYFFAGKMDVIFFNFDFFRLILFENTDLIYGPKMDVNFFLNFDFFCIKQHFKLFCLGLDRCTVPRFSQRSLVHATADDFRN
jgi:hypothetical protein